MSQIRQRFQKLEAKGLSLESYEDPRQGLVPHGAFVMRYDNGAKALEGRFQHGKAHGLWCQWYSSGVKRAQYEYHLGRPHGEFRQWYPRGSVAQEGAFRRGVLEGELKIYADGKGRRRQAMLESRYKKGQRVGKVAQMTRQGRELAMDLAVRDQRLTMTGGSIQTHAKRICLVDPRGATTVARIEDITDFLGERLSPAEVESYLGMMNELYSQLGFDTSHGLLVKCTSGFSAMPLVSGAQGAGPTPEPQELQAARNACQSQASSRLGLDGGISGTAQWQSFVEQQVERVEGIFDSCVDTANPLVASGDVSADDVVDLIVKAVKAAMKIVQDIGDAVDDAVDGAEETAEAAAGAGADWVDGKVREAAAALGRAEDEPRSAVAAVALIAGFYALKALSSSPGYGDPGHLEYTMAMDKLSSAILDSILEDPTQGPVGDGGVSGGGGQGGGAEDMLPGTGGTCADMQEWWARVKSYCDDASWQTMECQQFLGASSDCLERILPGPDGGPVCYGVTGSDSDEDLMWAVRRRICEMTSNGYVVSDGFGNERCMRPSEVAPAEYDPCQDPAAQWLPDQCLDSLLDLATGSSVPPPTQRQLEVLTGDSFDLEVARSDGPVMVAFTAASCGPCLRVAETLGEVEDDFDGRLRFRQVDIHQNPDLAVRFNIRHTPTLLTFKAGEVVGQRRVGAAPAERLVKYVDKTLRDLG